MLDFFAGSGTTAQAVLKANNEDNGNRKFILCTNNQNILFNAYEMELLNNKGFNYIPKGFFGQELKEAAE